ncbi:MAG: AAA family ATPase [Planctomycetes bacterium]|nr:AAA family ATPase [Planctomycetota bacterium]
MYENHWGLKRTPFRNDQSPETYFSSSSHQSALLKLRFLVEHRRGAGLLVGPSGAGKTRLLQALLPETGLSAAPVVRIVYPLLSPVELLSFIVTELGAEQSAFAGPSMDLLLRQMVERLRQLVAEGTPAVILIDDAHAITDRLVLQSLHLLLNLQQHPGVEFTMILAGQPDLVTTTRRLPQLDDRISIPCVLTAMSAAESAGYIEHRLQAAGATEPIFSRAALQAVHELSGGLPRRINRLCDFALLVGYAERLGLIDAPHIEGVSAELSLSRAA